MGCTKGKLGAVFFAVLMATSMVAMPALAAGPSANGVGEQPTGFTTQNDGPPGHGDGPPGHGDGPPGHDRGDANVTVPELESNTSIETAVNATERLDDLDLETDETAAMAANETVAAVNASLQAYRHLEYVDSRESFERFADAQRSLAALANAVDEEDRAIVDEISQNLYAASDRSARLTVVDAKSVVAANDDEFRNPGQRQSAESALGNAIDALERADGAVETDADPADRAKATIHLENAWKHGERALDTVERNTEPTLSLSQERAFERNDSIVVPLQATLDDVRPYAYDEATVTVEDGEATAEDVSLIAGESATSTASGTTFVDLGSEPENATVTVAATAEHDDERTVKATTAIQVDEDAVIPDLPDPDEYQEVEVTNESAGVSVEVGGDGLHETDISVTDETPETDDPYRAGPMVRITTDTAIDEATVEIPIDEDDLARTDRDDTLSIHTWDPHDDEPWTPVETEIDRDAGTAIADVEGFSFVSVYWEKSWEDTVTETITLEERHTERGFPDNQTIGDRVWNLNDNPDGVLVGDHEWNDEGATTNEHDSDASLRIADDGGVDSNFVFEDDDDITIDLHWRHESGGELAYLFNDQDSTTTGFRAFTNGIADDGLYFRNTFGGNDIAVDGTVFDTESAVTSHSQTADPALDAPENDTGETTANQSRLDSQSQDVSTQSSASLQDGQWYQIRIVLDADEHTYTVYLNDGDGFVEAGQSYYDGSGFATNPQFRMMGRQSGSSTAVSYDWNLWTDEAIHPDDAETIDSGTILEYPLDNRSAGELRDSSGDGIPDVLAEMDLKMPTGSDLAGEPLNLDPNTTDTSGDGLLDNETVDISYRTFVEDGERKIEATVDNAEHHPARIDTTGDGLTDREQLEGWEIEVVDDHGDASSMMKAVSDPDDDTDPAQFFDTRAVEANPLLSDTSGGGLTDVDELELGTDPETTDTTGDGVTDFEAVNRYDRHEDPTVFTTTAPSVHLSNHDSGWVGDRFEWPRYTFQYQYRIEDAAGVSSSQLEQSGISGEYNTYHGPTSIVEFEAIESEWEGLQQWSRGVDTRITTEDVHGNDATRMFTVQRSVGSELATEFPWLDDEEMGLVSGWTHGAAELPDLVLMLWRSPGETAEALSKLAEEYATTQVGGDPTAESEFWLEMARGMSDSMHFQQHTDNPHDPPVANPDGYFDACGNEFAAPGEPQSDYCEFAAGWYQGYSLFIIAETVGGTSSLKAADSVEDVADAAGTAGRNMDDVHWGSRMDAPTSKTTRINQQLVPDGGNPQIDAADVTRHLREDHGIETSGGIKHALDQLDTNIHHLEELSASEQAALGARLSRSQDPSATRAFVNELDDVNDVRYVLEEDAATTNRLVNWHANPGAHRHVDPNLDANDLVHVARNGDVNEVRAIVKGSDEFQDRGSVQWLESGDASSGLEHIEHRHVTDDQFLAIDGVDNVDDVIKSVYDTISAGNAHRIPDNEGGGTAYVHKYTPDDEVSVIVGDNGYIVTARPGGYP